MSYSDNISEMLKEGSIDIGDRIKIVKDGETYEGILMPRSKQGDSEAIVLKLDSGYNIGIRCSGGEDIELVENQEKTVSEEEEVSDHDPEKPDVAVLHTGGTIASKVSYEEGGVIPAFDPEDLLQMYPELFEEVNVESEVISQMLSEDMEPDHWKKIAEAVSEHRDKDGIIIGHGTDTMQYTAAALSFMLQNIDIPVVLVGAQRSSDRPSSDAALNLLSAVRFIEEGISGVYICMHGSSNDDKVFVHRGTRARKMHTSRRDAFKSIDEEPFAEVDYRNDKVEVNGEIQRSRGDFELKTEINFNVGILKSRPGLDEEDVGRYEDYDGLVIEGTGLGHLPVNSFDEYTEHHEDILNELDSLGENTVVVMTSQCISGRINMNVYDAGVKINEAGVISSENMVPEVAYVKLMWALGQTDTVEETKKLFKTNVSGEITEREEYDVFRD